MGLTAREQVALLNLLAVPGIGSWGAIKLVQAFGLPSAVFAATPAALRSVPRVGEQVIEQLRGGSAEAEAGRKQHEAARNLGARLLSYWDEDYPFLLKQLEQEAPALLFVKGDLAPEARRVAVVGTRRASEYGRRLTKELISGLRGSGVEVISGLASGIDGAAHLAAVEASLVTHAVFGCGLDTIYPEQNAGLAQKILAAGGSWISDFPPGTKPSTYTFPQRNRIIAGLSQATVVVEAPAKSGALITARLAGEYGRDVGAIPGSVTGGKSAGCHDLIKNGAQLIEESAEILSLLRVRGQAATRELAPLPDLPGPEGALVRALDAEQSIHIDLLAEQTSMGTGEALSRLLLLELKGLVKQLPGKYFVRV